MSVLDSRFFVIYQDPTKLMKGFFILIKVNQCESVSGKESHFSIVLDTRNVPISAQSKPGSRVGAGGRREGRISEISMILSRNISVPLSTHLELRTPPLRH